MPHQYVFPENPNALLAASGIGLWHFDTHEDVFHFNDTATALAGQSKFLFEELILKSGITSSEQELFRSLLKSTSETITFQLHLGGKELLFKGVFTEETGYSGTLQEVYHKGSYKGELLSSLIEQAPVATCLFTGPEMKIEIANEVMLGYWGKGTSVLGKPLAEALPELKGQPFLDILAKIYATGEIHEETEAEAQLVVNGVLGTYYFDYTYKPVRDAHGNVFGVMDMAIDVTERVLSKREQQKTESRFRSVTEQNPAAIAFLMGKEMRVEIANEVILKIWGKDKSILGSTLKEALPEIEGQGFLELLDNVYTSGETFRGNEILVKLEHEGELIDVYVDFTYSPLRDADGTINGVLVLANDVSDRILSLRELAASEEKFKSVIYSAQAAVAVFRGADLVTDIANDEFLRFVGRTREEMVGKPLLESMPEIIGQESEHLLKDVYQKGIKTHHFGRMVHVMRNGVLTQNYYNVSYSPLYDGNGDIYGVLDMAIDVTETIKAQEALREAEASLRSAIELADLATWSLDPITERFTYSGRIKEWMGLDGEPEVLDDSLDVLHKADRERVRQAVFKAIDPESDGIFNAEFRIINRTNGSERILHAVGKTFFNDSGLPYLLTGTAQDITSVRKVQLALENQVKERTDALQRANRELEDINLKLVNTNKELEQYAYVASHDLQEPLRKISMFSNLLKERDKENTHKTTIDKIVIASQRMSLLIKDLLEFSRLINPDTRFTPTNLEDVIQTVKHDFELLIDEKNAEVITQTLPVIDAVPLQMNQLFYNLIGNALKFTVQGVAPVVSISGAIMEQGEVSIYIKNPLPVNYYKIAVSDNGIGIEEQYTKQIFEVFKRLHSRSEYSGSGIGLALCRRIADNHNGAIYIESVPGQGTTFFVLLPEKQSV
jgi:PAS domain S-box-containing protein